MAEDPIISDEQVYELELLLLNDPVVVGVRREWRRADEELKKHMRFITELGIRDGTNFQSQLIRLILKADRTNLQLLYSVYPFEVAAAMGTLRYSSFYIDPEGNVLPKKRLR